MAVFRMFNQLLQRLSKLNPHASDPTAIKSVIRVDVSVLAERAILTRHAPNPSIKIAHHSKLVVTWTIMKSISRGFKRCSLYRRINKLSLIDKYMIKHQNSEEKHKIKGLLLRWNRFKNLLTKALWFIQIMKMKTVCWIFWIMHLSKVHYQWWMLLKIQI